MTPSTFRLTAMALALAASCFFTKASAQTTVIYASQAQGTFVVPAGITSIQVDIAGGAGSSNGFSTYYGNGMKILATLAVTPGQTLYIYPGGRGYWNHLGFSLPFTGNGGWNGGGNGSLDTLTGNYGGGGGGASDIRIGGTALSNRVIVASGGGGSNDAVTSSPTSYGGIGDAATGGSPTQHSDVSIATGGSQVAGGLGGDGFGANGTLGTGGDGAISSGGGGGGGGGYYGGGGGDNDGGAGGSSYTDPVLVTSITNMPGYESDNGHVYITYIPAPAFTTLPTSSSVCLGSPVSTLTATVTNATSYQWYLNNTSIPNNFTAIGGATSNTYNISSLAYTDTGMYFLAATNVTGTTYSDTVEVSVLAPTTTITSSPAASTHICFGGSSTISGAASGAGLSYQWYVNTGSGYNPISDNWLYSGSATSSLQISNVISAMSGYQYQLTATGTCGSANTTATTLTVDSTIVTSSPAASTHICFGSSSTIAGTATGPGLSYHWFVNTGSGFTPISDNWNYSGSITSSLHISHVISVMTGYVYQLTVTGTCGSANTTATTLTVDTTIITSSPATSTHICFGGSSIISGSASGPVLTYQWYVNTGSGYNAISDNWNYSGSATSSLQLSNVITAMTGYQYKLAVTGTCSAVFTTPTTLTVDTTIITSNLPTRSHICFGGNSTISATASGPGLVYQWTANTGSGFVNLSDNATYTGTHTNTLHIVNSNFSFGGYKYQLNVTGTCGAASTIVTTAVVDSFPLPITFNPNYNWALQGQVNVIYSTNLDTDVNYVWAYNGSGVSIANSGDTARYTYDVAATSGNVSVFATSPYGCGTTSTISQGITVYPYDIWTGDSSKNWNDTNNWDRHIVPYGTISAYIPTILTPLVGVMDTPEISTVNTNACYRLYMEANSGLIIDAGLKLLVNSNATLLASVQGAGILSFAGTSAQTITASDTVYNLEINNSHGVTLPQNSRIHIKYNYYPTSGTFTNNGIVFLISDATGTATVNAGSSAGGYITGTAINVQKYIHGGRRAYRFLAHPFSSSIALSQLQSAFDITGHGTGFTTTGTNNPSAFWYNPVTANGSDTDDVTGWIPYTATDGVGANAWNPYEGLRIMVRGLPGEGLLDQPYTPSATTINMYGQLTQGDQSVALTTNANKGYNFVANPYAASIDLSTLTLGSSVGPNFWVWDPNQGLAGAYVSQPLSVSYILPAYSSFVVTATAATNNTVGFHESSKSTATAANLFKTTGSSMGYDMMQLHILSDNNATSWDRLLIYFRGDANPGTDVFDAAKWANDDLNFYTYSTDNKQQSIDVRPYIDGQVIQLGLNATQQKTYSMSVDDFNMDPNVKIYLHDKYLNKVQLLSQGYVYSFTVNSDANSQGDNRFELNQVGVATGVANIVSSKLNVSIAPNPTTDVAILIYAAAVKGATSLRVTNVVGQQIYSKDLGDQQAGSIEISVADMAPGIYLINLKCGDEMVTKRLVKQ